MNFCKASTQAKNANEIKKIANHIQMFSLEVMVAKQKKTPCSRHQQLGMLLGKIHRFHKEENGGYFFYILDVKKNTARTAEFSKF